MNKTIQDVKTAKKGDIIVLRDFHTLEAVGQEYSGQISKVNVWRNNHLTAYGLEIAVSDDTTLMLLVRGDEETADIRLFRLWESSLAMVILKSLPLLSKDANGLLSDFTNFDIVFGNGDFRPVRYSVKNPPYPFWDIVKSDGSKVALCEYFSSIEGTPIDGNFWAKSCFVEWHAYVGGPKADGAEGLLSVWFGWDVGSNDFDIINQ
jgi:hypothetical protein